MNNNFSSANNKDRFEKYETIYVRLCSNETTNYIRCLNTEYQEWRDCNELRKKYLYLLINYQNHQV